MAAAPASKPCAVKWCVALATRGEYCPVHAESTADRYEVAPTDRVEDADDFEDDPWVGA